MDKSWVGVLIGAVSVIIVEVIRRKKPGRVARLENNLHDLQSDFDDFKKALSMVFDQLERDNNLKDAKLLRDFRKLYKL